MDRKSYTNSPFDPDAATSPHLGGSNFQGSFNGDTLYHHPQHQQFSVGDYTNYAHNPMVLPHPYPESHQRGLIQSDNLGFVTVRLSNSFDAPHLGSANPYPGDYNHFDIPHSSIEDRPRSVSIPIDFPSRPVPPDITLPRKMSAQYQTANPSFFPSTLSRAMTYTEHSVPSATEAVSAVMQADELMLASFVQVSRNPDNSLPSSSSTISYQAMAGNEVLRNDVSHSLNMANHELLIHQHPPIPPPMSTSIPMRKLSPEWMTQSGFLSETHSHERYTSPAFNVDTPPLRGGTAASKKDANSFTDRSQTGKASPSIPQPQTQSMSKSSSPLPSDEPVQNATPPKKKKKSKMHACEICDKKFPRPSGLKTHMNTHNNARPYPCGFPGCTRTFGVRSNAKRHLRTHGIVPPPAGEGAGELSYVVGFSTPVVVPPPDMPPSLAGDHLDGDGASRRNQATKAPFFKLRWMPPSLTTRTNAASLKSVSEDGEISDEDEDEEEDPDSILFLNGRDLSRSGTSSNTSVARPPFSINSSSNSSSSMTPPECACPVPCASSPCLSLIAENRTYSFPASSAASAMSLSSNRGLPSDMVPSISKAAMQTESGQYHSLQYWVADYAFPMTPSLVAV